MFKIILISIISFFSGAMTIILFAMMKVSSECSRKEEKFIDYGRDVYKELEKLEKEKKDSNVLK